MTLSVVEWSRGRNMGMEGVVYIIEKGVYNGGGREESKIVEGGKILDEINQDLIKREKEDLVCCMSESSEIFLPRHVD